MRTSLKFAVSAGLLFPLMAMSSCEKAKKLAELASKFKSKTPGSSASAPAASGPTIDRYPEFIKQPGKLVVVDFNATWCGPCKLVGPMLEKIADEKKDVLVLGKIDVDQYADLAKSEGVSSIPDIRIFLNGSKVDSFIGAPPEAELRARIEKQLANLGANGAAAGKASATAGKAPPITPATKDWMPKGMQRR